MCFFNAESEWLESLYAWIRPAMRSEAANEEIRLRFVEAGANGFSCFALSAQSYLHHPFGLSPWFKISNYTGLYIDTEKNRLAGALWSKLRRSCSRCRRASCITRTVDEFFSWDISCELNNDITFLFGENWLVNFRKEKRAYVQGAVDV